MTSSPQSAWTRIQPYLIVGRIAVLLLDTLVYLLHHYAQMLTFPNEQELSHAKRSS